MIIRRILDKLNGELSCAEVLELLQGYLDEVIDPEDARKVAKHLEKCAHCEADSLVYRQIKATLARRSRPVDPHVLESLEQFGRRLMDDTPSA